jgi:hypothetical protein
MPLKKPTIGITMAKKLKAQPQKIDLSQEVEVAGSDEPEIKTRRLPIKTAIIRTADKRREED